MEFLGFMREEFLICSFRERLIKAKQYIEMNSHE